MNTTFIYIFFTCFVFFTENNVKVNCQILTSWEDAYCRRSCSEYATVIIEKLFSYVGSRMMHVECIYNILITYFIWITATICYCEMSKSALLEDVYLQLVISQVSLLLFVIVIVVKLSS